MKALSYGSIISIALTVATHNEPRKTTNNAGTGFNCFDVIMGLNITELHFATRFGGLTARLGWYREKRSISSS